MTDSILNILRDAIVVGWRPLIEVALLAVAIYYFFLFLRGTRGWAVVLGLTGVLMLVLTLTVVTNLLGLTVLSRMIGWFLVGLPVAALIIFQPELRRMLAEFGNLPLFNTQRQERENIEIIVRAMERLSKKKVGALVAIEQATQLHTAVETGVAIDCLATPEMFETIFFPNNAIHDGGILVKADRIASAACIFPLTQRADIEKTLGTRHRAALGLSEETDAVVIIVSEETGAISYSYKGYLERGVTLNELRSFLSSILVKKVKPRTLQAWFRRRNRSMKRDLIKRIKPRRNPPANPAESGKKTLSEEPIESRPTVSSKAAAEQP